MNIGQSKTYYTHTVGERLPIDKGPLQAELINDGDVDSFVWEPGFLSNIDQARQLLKRPEILAGIQQAMVTEAQRMRVDQAKFIAQQFAKATSAHDLNKLAFAHLEDPVAHLESPGQLCSDWRISSQGQGTGVQVSLRPMMKGLGRKQELVLEHNSLMLKTTKAVAWNTEEKQSTARYFHKISGEWLPSLEPVKERESLTLEW